MTRLGRYFLPDQPQHLIQRGNNRGTVFFSDDDRLQYLDWLREAAADFGCRIHAYVLMTNHVHLLATPERADSLPRMMQTLGRRYVRYVNTGLRRTGTLWEGRYRAAPIDSEAYFLACCRYIELNPVRARMVDHPRAWKWSSFRAHADGRHDPLVSDHPLYRALGRSHAGEIWGQSEISCLAAHAPLGWRRSAAQHPLARPPMTRLGRYFLPDQPQHLIQRGNNRGTVFFSDDDRLQYLDWLREAAADFGCRIHAYVLMTNHVHLLATPRARRQPAADDADARPALRALRQHRPAPHRHVVGRPLPCRADRQRGLLSSPAAATSSSTRCAPAWSTIRAPTNGRVFARMPTAGTIRWSAIIRSIARSAAATRRGRRRIARCFERRSTASGRRAAPRDPGRLGAGRRAVCAKGRKGQRPPRGEVAGRPAAKAAAQGRAAARVVLTGRSGNGWRVRINLALTTNSSRGWPTALTTPTHSASRLDISPAELLQLHDVDEAGADHFRLGNDRDRLVLRLAHVRLGVAAGLE